MVKIWQEKNLPSPLLQESRNRKEALEKAEGSLTLQIYGQHVGLPTYNPPVPSSGLTSFSLLKEQSDFGPSALCFRI